jgi:hypothetical protein
LRRLRKKLRAEKRKKRRLLKGGDQKVSAAETVPLVKEEPEVELEAPLWLMLQRPVTSEQKAW